MAAGSLGAWMGTVNERLENEMATTTEHEHPFRGFDESVEHTLGADMRLIYGFAVPILMVTGLVVILALTPATWLLVSIMVLEVAALCVVVTGFMGMLNEPADEDLSER
jgi:hypothetical protein